MRIILFNYAISIEICHHIRSEVSLFQILGYFLTTK